MSSVCWLPFVHILCTHWKFPFYNTCFLLIKKNIDDLSEHEILNVLRQMMMSSTAYLTENDDHMSAQLIIFGFSRTLRSWWDNC